MDAKETFELVAGANTKVLNMVKMEANENLDMSSGSKEPMEHFIPVKVENETEDTPVKVIKRKTEFEDIKNDPGSPESEHSITPDWFEVPVEREKDSPEIKYSNTQDYLDIKATVISEQDRAITEQDRARPGTSKSDVKCQADNPKNKEIANPAGQKQFKCEKCDYNTRRLSNLNRHMRTHTRDAGDVKCQTYIPKNKEIAYPAGQNF